MIPVAHVRHVFVAQYRVDFRKYHHGLLAECYRLGLDPYQGDVVLFVGRCRRRLKLLFADGNGLWVAGKLFNAGAMKTKFRFLDDPAVTTITQAELGLLLEGSAYRIDAQMKSW